MQLSDFYYDLPESLIAQTPLEQRDASRLLHLDRQTGVWEDRRFYDILDYLREGDCLIANNSRVIPARLFAKNATGAQIEVFLLRPRANDAWECLVRPGKKAKIGTKLYLDDVEATVLDIVEDGNRVISFSYDGDLSERLKQLGEVPLPPYIHEHLADSERYQTVYSKPEGSVAAPTAGLHFTPALLDRIRAKGVRIGYVTLHVGLGTFRPVKVDNPEEHIMHSEYYVYPQETADLIVDTKKNGGRVIAVGTTACRTLETVGQTDFTKAASGDTSIFIYPGYHFRVIDGLVTNFHLPESTLLMLVSAFAGREHILAAYEHAVNAQYRFFSFGDAMLLL